VLRDEDFPRDYEFRTRIERLKRRVGELNSEGLKASGAVIDEFVRDMATIYGESKEGAE
jgi:hypothetical protein